MTPGEFNSELSSLENRLIGNEEPLVRIAAFCSFLHVTHKEFVPREQWGQKAKLVFAGQGALPLRAMLTTERLLNLTPDQLVELEGYLNEISRTSVYIGDILEKITVARVLQYLFVGETARAGELLGITIAVYKTRHLVTRAKLFLSDVKHHPLAPHLLKNVRAWKQQSSRRMSDSVVHVLLVSPRMPGWSSFGILAEARYQQKVGASERDYRPPEISSTAAKHWLSDRHRENGVEVGSYSCAGLSSEPSGNSHTLALSALIAMNSGKMTGSWERIGYTASFAMTGEVDSEGWVKSVDELEAKLARAFYSPLLSLAVPASQTREAQAALDRLKEQAPLRRLRLLPAGSLSDVLERPVGGLQRRVDPIKWIVHRGSRASRAIAFSASVLFLIGAIQLVLLAFPKLSPWFDWQPCFWDVRDGQHVVLMNREGQQISRVSMPRRWRPGARTASDFTNLFDEGLVKLEMSDSSLKLALTGVEQKLSCQLADATGDGQKEAFVRCSTLLDNDTTWNRALLYCLTLERGVLWFSGDYEIVWSKTLDFEDFSPLIGVPARYPTEIRAMTTVDWRGDGHANLILSMHDCKPQNNGSAYLEEVDGRSGETLGRFWHSQWFFGLSAVTELESQRQTLWAGTFGAVNATPELYVFRDSLRSRVWPCDDTTGFRVIRYPYCDVALAFGVPTHVGRIQQQNQRRAEIRIVIGSTQHHVDAHNDWRGFTFLVDHNANWIRDSFDLSYAQHLYRFEKDGYIKLPDDLDEWLPPLTYGEQWTGSGWIPADTTRPRPEPFPIFEASDPRLQKDIKLPVKWQEL